jgi:uncharacterized membrane protein
MADSSQQTITIGAPVDRIAAVITDFRAYPEWVGAMKDVQVLEEYEDGYASQVRFTLDAGIVTDVYTLRYEYSPDVTRIQWQLVEGRTQKRQEGSYDLTATPTGTEVTYSLLVELTIPMLGMFKRKAEKVIMDSALRDLKKRVESLPA